MIKDQSAELIEGLFADDITRDPEMNRRIRNTSADLPEEFVEDAADLARWLIAVIRTTRTSDASGRNARERALHAENGRLRTLLRNERFSQNALQPLHDRLAEAVVNAGQIGNRLALEQIAKFLNAQTRRQIASPERQQMSQTG